MTLPASVVPELRGHVMRFAGPVYVFPAPEGGPLHAEYWRDTVWRPAGAPDRADTDASARSQTRGRCSPCRGAGVDAGEIARRAGHADPGFTLAATATSSPRSSATPLRKLHALRGRLRTTYGVLWPIAQATRDN